MVIVAVGEAIPNKYRAFYARDACGPGSEVPAASCVTRMVSLSAEGDTA